MYKDVSEFFSEFERDYSERVLNKAPFHFSKEQKNAIEYNGGHCLIRSSAGSGKTVILIARFFYLVRVKGVCPKEILLLAYTNAVCDEINEKIRKLWNNDVEFFTNWDKNPFQQKEIIGPAKTFHRFASSIIIGLTGRKPSFLGDINKKAIRNLRLRESNM